MDVENWETAMVMFEQMEVGLGIQIIVDIFCSYNQPLCWCWRNIGRNIFWVAFRLPGYTTGICLIRQLVIQPDVQLHNWHLVA